MAGTVPGVGGRGWLGGPFAFAAAGCGLVLGGRRIFPRAGILMVIMLLGLGTVGTDSASAVTIATFSDPTAGTSPIQYMFSIRDGAPTGTITEPANAPLVDLRLDPFTGAGGLYTGVDLVFPTLSYTGSFLAGGVVGPGYFDFQEQGQSLLRIDFDSAYVSRSNFGADDIFSANNVRFSVQGVPLAIGEHSGSFSFSFTNQKVAGTGYDATAAFTSSATPEPAALVVIALGAGLILLPRRH